MRPCFYSQACLEAITKLILVGNGGREKKKRLDHQETDQVFLLLAVVAARRRLRADADIIQQWWNYSEILISGALDKWSRRLSGSKVREPKLVFSF